MVQEVQDRFMSFQRMLEARNHPPEDLPRLIASAAISIVTAQQDDHEHLLW